MEGQLSTGPTQSSFLYCLNNDFNRSFSERLSDILMETFLSYRTNRLKTYSYDHNFICCWKTNIICSIALGVAYLIPSTCAYQSAAQSHFAD